MKLIDAVDWFYLSMEGIKSAKTVLWYKRRLPLLINFFGEDRAIETITIEDLQKWRASLSKRSSRYTGHPTRKPISGGLSVDTLHGYIRAAKRLFRVLYISHKIDSNPAMHLELPRLPVRRVRGISSSDRDRMLKVTEDNPRDFCIIIMLADTAARVGGLANLTLDDIDLEARLATVHEKGQGGGKERPIFFTQKTVDAIRAYLRVRPKVHNDHLFIGKQGPLTEAGIYMVLKRAAEAAGVTKKYNPHSFRHGSLRGLLENGTPLPIVSQIAGHSSVKVTGDIYGSFPDRELQEYHDRGSWIKDED